jgi:hypothetical protein
MADQHAALTSLYAATGGDRWLSSTGWTSGNTTLCSSPTAWHGVTCDAYGGSGRAVVGLDLSANGLTGALPQAPFGSLTALAYVGHAQCCMCACRRACAGTCVGGGGA